MKYFTSLLCLLFFGALFTKISGDEECLSGQFKCTKSGRCIAGGWRCDGDVDCGSDDDSDETNCDSKTCPTDEFQCKSGQCILSKWKCDGEKDCHDGSDESPESCNNTKCEAEEFRCHNGQCISSSWVCDGTNDCSEGEDEKCDAPTCAEDEMRCAISGKCLTKKWVCDGQHDCGEDDTSDEANCTSSCGADSFKCLTTGGCITSSWRCDGDYDCEDHSDEKNCTKEHTQNQCIDTEWSCLVDEQCILKTWKCDGDADCFDGTDEENCNYTCKAGEFRCGSGHCIEEDSKCDGHPDCEDNTDEENCPFKCEEGQFDCSGNGKKCIDASLVCDGHIDCDFHQDEDEELCKANPCKENNGCEHLCEPLQGHTFKCLCHPGYKLVNKTECININECIESEVPVCSQVCEDTKGSYHCSCVEGYERESLTGDPRNTTCKIKGQRPHLLFANKHDVRKLEVGTWIMEPVVDELSSAIAVAFYKEKYIYWSDSILEKISRTEIHSDGTVGEKKDIIKVSTHIKTADGIAVDWVNDLLYWTDTGLNSVLVGSLDGEKKMILLDNNLDEPRGIALDPRNGYFYLTDWGKNPKIERIGMDGTQRKDIITTNIVWPNSITIDFISDRIYWIDAKLNSISCANLDGSHARFVLQNAQQIAHPFAIAVFEDIMYWTDWASNSIRQAHKHSGENYKQLMLGLKSPMGLQILHQSVQTPGHSVCVNNNGGCQYLCLPGPKSTHTCACPENQVLADDKKNCVNKAPTDKPSTVKPVISTSYSPNSSNKNRTTTVTTDRPLTTPKAQKSTSSLPMSSTITRKNTAIDKTTSQPVVETTIKPGTHAPSTHKPIPISTEGPTYHTVTDQVNKTRADIQDLKPEEQTGTVAFIAIGVVAFLILFVVVIGCFIYRRLKKRNIKSMNFDNPVYRKTTTTEDSIMINHHRDHHIKGDHSEIKPLTEDV